MGKNLYDLIIIGAGPAGLSAAIYAGRAKLKTLVLDPSEPGGQIRTTNEVVNYPGILKTTGSDFSDTMVKQAKNFSVEIINAMVTDVNLTDSIKNVKTSLGEYNAISVVIATGTKYIKLGFEGEDKYTGRGVGYCATCDGEFFTDMDIFVIGAGFAAAEEAMFLTRYGKTVTIIAREPEFTCSKTIADKVLSHPKIKVKFNTEILSLQGDDFPRKAVFVNNQTGEKWEHNSKKGESFGVFIFVGYRPQTNVFNGKIKLDKQGYVIVDDKLLTSTEGVYAAGDIIQKDLRQIVTAVSDGAVASTNAEKYIENKKAELNIVIENNIVTKNDTEVVNNADEAEPSLIKTKSFIDSELASQVKPVLDRLINEVNLVLIKKENNKMSDEMEIFLKDMINISEKLNLEIYQETENTKIEEIIKGTRYPVIALLNNKKEFTGIKYNAVPSGHEFNSFILGLYNTAGPGQEVSKELLEKIKEIDSPLNIQIGISLSCTMCPEVVQAAQQIALHNKKVSAEFIDISHFPDFKNRYNIMSVPATVINEKEIIFGKKTLEELVDELIKIN